MQASGKQVFVLMPDATAMHILITICTNRYSIPPQPYQILNKGNNNNRADSICRNQPIITLVYRIRNNYFT